MSSKDQGTEEQRLAPIRDKIDALDARYCLMALQLFGVK